MECLLKELQSCQNNPKNSYTKRKAIHEPSGWVMFTKCSLDKTENKLNHYRGIDCIKNVIQKIKRSCIENLCQLHYKILLITYLKLTKKNAKHA